MTDVEYTAAKVQLFDSIGRHQGKFQPFYAHDACIQPLLHFDGSVQTRRTNESNLGFRPNSPADPNPTVFRYFPRLNPGKFAWEPAPMSGGNFDEVIGHYGWTRGGLKGVDFDMGEVDSGQP